MTMKSIFWLAAMAAALVAIPGHATTIFDQSPPNFNAVDMVDSRVADSFSSLSAFTIGTVNFWYQAQFETDLSTVAWAFYRNSGGVPGTLLYSGAAAPTTSIDTNAFFASFGVSNLSFSPGIYWLELHAGSSLTDNTNNGSTFTVFWSNVDGTPTLPTVINSGLGLPTTPVTTPGFEESAFQLLGTSGGGGTVPEPSAFLLIGSGLALVWWRKGSRAP